MSEHISSPSAHLAIWTTFSDREYRVAYNEAHGSDFLASQIHALRAARGWTQGELATRAKVTQPMVCDWEKSCEGIRLSSIYKLASAFDVAVLVKFVPFSQLAREAIDARADGHIPSYDDESPMAIRHSHVVISDPSDRNRPRRQGGANYGRRELGMTSAHSEARFLEIGN